MTMTECLAYKTKDHFCETLQRMSVQIPQCQEHNYRHCWRQEVFAVKGLGHDSHFYVNANPELRHQWVHAANTDLSNMLEHHFN